MNLDFTKEQKMLKASARDFLKSKCPKDLVRDLEKSEQGYSLELWNEMVELGWLDLIIPEEYNGLGMTFLDLIILLEEIGYNLLPGPYFQTVIGTIAILLCGSEKQKKEILPNIADGKIKMSLAITEPGGSYRPTAIRIESKNNGNEYAINGTKLFVENAHIADYFILASRTTAAQTPEEGISLFLVDANTKGISNTVIPNLGMYKQCELAFNDVKVPKQNLLGESDRGWTILEKIIEHAAVGKCAEMLGGMAASLDMTLKHVKDRTAYGRPLSSYQVLQHYLAECWLFLESSRHITYKAAWTISEGLPSTLLSSAAKFWLAKSFAFVTERCIQMHGAIGMTREYDIGLYYRNARVCDLAFGDTAYQKEKIAQLYQF